MAVPLAQAINLQGMVLVVGAYLGPISVVIFSTLRTLTRLALQIVLAVSNTAEPELAAAHGARDAGLMQSIFLNVLRGGFWLSSVVAIALYAAGDFVLRHWTHNAVPMNGVLFVWLLGSAVASVLWYGALVLLRAANGHLRASAVYVVASGVALVVAAILLTLTGKLACAGMALLVMDFAMAIYALGAASRLLGVSPVPYLADAINPLPLLALVISKPSTARK
jgi:O-antigen/teichoic acid export membrane protein